MYSVLDYGRMSLSGVRMDAYARAIARVVKPGSVVLDLGSGTGILALLAARAGARRVHAVETNPAVLLLPELAAANGLADRITVHHASSFEVELPEQVDVIVSDLRGTSPLHGDHTAAVADARARWLAPGGALLPAKDRLFVALVESPALASRLEAACRSFDRFGLDGAAVRPSVFNQVYDDRAAPLEASDVLSTAGCWGTLDYQTYDGRAIEGAVELAATRAGTAHGLALWFEATVHEDITYTTAPGWSLPYARCFVPLLQPVAMGEGDRATVTMRADARGGQWGWDTRVVSAGGVEAASFRQATFLGAPTSPEALLRGSSAFRPTPNGRGERLARLLGAMDGARSVADLAAVLEASLTAPASASRRARLLDEVRAAVGRYAR
jgi:protein arginine N-methyltransferase 1